MATSFLPTVRAALCPVSTSVRSRPRVTAPGHCAPSMGWDTPRCSPRDCSKGARTTGLSGVARGADGIASLTLSRTSRPMHWRGSRLSSPSWRQPSSPATDTLCFLASISRMKSPAARTSQHYTDAPVIAEDW